MTVRDQIKAMPVDDRIVAARGKLQRLVNHVMSLLALHETNAIVLYSATLSAQIPMSRAGNAFLAFQQGLHQIEIVRLCALWDKADLDKESIPTVIELIDDPGIIETLALEMESYWANSQGALLNPSSDPDLAAAEIAELRSSEAQFGKEQGNAVRSALKLAIANSRQAIASDKYASVMNLRDKELAHSLSVTRREKTGPVAPMRYGDERDLLETSLPIVEALHRGVNGAGFSFVDSREIDRRNAKALWEGCTFAVKE